jgi:hypothetical protein
MTPKQTIPVVLNALPAENDGKRNGNGLLLHQKKYSIKQASELAGIGETTMRRSIMNGDIQVLRIGAKTMMLEQDLEAFLQGSYGIIKQDEPSDKKIISLPSHIEESDLLNPRSKSA